MTLWVQIKFATLARLKIDFEIKKKVIFSYLCFDVRLKDAKCRKRILNFKFGDGDKLNKVNFSFTFYWNNYL